MNDPLEVLQVPLIENKWAIINYLSGQTKSHMGDVDMIDISGAVLASRQWDNYIRDMEFSRARWRVLLLRPGSEGAAVRANESTVWAGNQSLMEGHILQRCEIIKNLATDLGIDCQVRWYTDTPTSRYMKVGDVIFQSFYPANNTGQNVPIAVLGGDDVLGQRAKKEFSVRWNGALHN